MTTSQQYTGGRLRLPLRPGSKVAASKPEVPQRVLLTMKWNGHQVTESEMRVLEAYLVNNDATEELITYINLTRTELGRIGIPSPNAINPKQWRGQTATARVDMLQASWRRQEGIVAAKYKDVERIGLEDVLDDVMTTRELWDSHSC